MGSNGLLSLTLLVAAGAACTGVIGGDDEQPGAGGGGAAGAAAAASATDIDPTSVYLRRLNAREYQQTVADVFGETADLSKEFPPESALDGYDNNVLALPASGPLVEAYANLATQIAKGVLTSPTRRAKVLGCEPRGATRASCLDSILTTLGRRVFRRPLTTEERTDLLALANAAASDPDQDAPAQLLLEGLLQSSNFLYRVEVGEPLADKPGRSRLTGYEVASRLSYFLWGSAPDDALLDAAGKSELDTSAGVEKSARAMLGDARAKKAVSNFQQQWLGLGRLGSVSRSATYFPKWTATLKTSMAEETRLLLEDFTFRDGAAFLDLLTAKYSFVNSELAAHYGLPAPSGTGFSKVNFSATDPRAGVLTHASLLTAYSQSETLSPILRGKFIRDVFTCEHPPPPPPGVAPINEATPTSVREKLEQHRTNPACAGCHNAMDPVGFGFERYDIVGAYRTADSQGRPLTGQGSLEGFPNPGFVGPEELATRLRASPKVSACVIQNVVRFAMGRSIAPTDTPLIAAQDEAFRKNNLDFRSMLVAFVASDAFRTFKTTPAGGQ